MSGWDSPVSFQANRSFVWPEHGYNKIVARFGIPTFDDVDEFDADAPGWLERLGPALERRVARKTELCRWLLEEQDWDVFAVYFGESDTAAHYLWPTHDPHSPRRPDAWQNAPPFKSGRQSPLADVYRALDRSLAKLIESAGADVNVTIISDHGSGGSSDKVLYLNRALADADSYAFDASGFQNGPRARRNTPFVYLLLCARRSFHLRTDRAQLARVTGALFRDRHAQDLGL